MKTADMTARLMPPVGSETYTTAWDATLALANYAWQLSEHLGADAEVTADPHDECVSVTIGPSRLCVGTDMGDACTAGLPEGQAYAGWSWAEWEHDDGTYLEVPPTWVPAGGDGGCVGADPTEAVEHLAGWMARAAALAKDDEDAWEEE